MLAVRPQKVREALTWLKQNNPLYKDVEISNSNLRTYDDVVSHDVPTQLFEGGEQYRRTATDIIRTSQYVPAVDRGEEETGDPGNLETIIQSLDACNDGEADNAASEDGEDPETCIDEENPEQYPAPQMTSSACLDVDSGHATSATGQIENLQHILLQQRGGDEDGGSANRASNYTFSSSSGTDPFIVTRRGDEFADSFHPDFFPKTFPTLFPFGVGGPLAKDGSIPLHDFRGASDGDERRSTFGLRPWAAHCLKRHGMDDY